MELAPTDHAEAVAIFRATVIGPLMHRELTHGQLAAELRALSEQRFRPPSKQHTHLLGPDAGTLALCLSGQRPRWIASRAAQ